MVVLMNHRRLPRGFSGSLLVSFVCFQLVSALAELKWVEVPQKPATQPVEGSNVTLRWDYNLTGDTVFQVLWLDGSVFPSKTIGRLSSNNPVVFQDYRERFAIEKDEKATLVIRGVTRAESGGFRCQVHTNLGSSFDSTIEVDVLWSPHPILEKNAKNCQEKDEKATLIIRGVTRAESGEFRCEVQTNQGSSFDSTIEVDVVYQPENTSLTVHHVNTSAVQLNAVVNFTCASVANPDPHEFKLFVNGHDVHNSSSGLFSFAVSQRGNYSCGAVNTVGGGEQSSSLPITVFVLPRASVTSYATVTEGKDLNLTCHVTGSPPPWVEWTKVGDPAAVLSNTTVLTLRSVTRPGNANQTVQYRCTASNGYGEPDSAEVTVQVFSADPPENTSFTVHHGNTSAIESGTVVNLTCNSAANPAPHAFKLLVDGHEVHNSSSETFSVAVTQSGVYSCEAVNTVGSQRSNNVIITAFVPARVTMASYANVREGKDLNLACHVTGSPPPSVEWTKVGDPAALLSNTTVLTLRSVTRPGNANQMVQYRCTASNGYGESKSAEVTVQVFYPPEKLSVWHKGENVSGKTFAVEEGETVNVSASVEGNPDPMVIWARADAQERENGRNLMITDIRRAESTYKYNCTAQNEAGSKSVNFEIDVHYGAEVVAFTYIPPNVVMCVSDGNPKPNVTINGTDIREVGKGVVKAEVTGKKVQLWCHAENSLKRASKRLTVDRNEFEETQDVEGRMRFTDVDYEPKFDDKNSEEYLGFTGRFFKQLYETLENTSIVGARVDKLSPGSVVVDFTIFAKDTNAAKEVVSTLKAEVANGKFGSWTVDSLTLQGPTTPAPPTPTPTDHPSQVALEPGCPCAVVVGLSVLVAVQFVLIACLIGYICCSRRRGGGNQQHQGYEIPAQDGKRENIIMNTIAAVGDQPPFRGNTRSDYASLDEARRMPDIQPHASEYSSLSLRTRSWEVPRERLSIEKIIGKGAFGQVAKATVENLRGTQGKETVAVKMLKENAPASDRKDLLSELEIMKALPAHPHVIRLLGCVTTAGPLMVIIEYVPYGDLLGYLRKSRGLNDTYYKDPDVKPKTSLTSQQLMRFAWQVADGMSFLSSKKIVHRDLAARNVLVGEQEACKVTDFGMARDVHKEDIYQKKTRGRLPVKWTAYEALLRGTYSTKSDVWSFGVVLFEIFTVGGCPYPRIDRRKLADLLQQGYRMPKPVHLDDELYGIMLECWRESADQRPNFESLARTLQDLESKHKRLIDMKKYDKKLYENVDDLFGE